MSASFDKGTGGMSRFLILLLGVFLVSLGIVWAVGPFRLLAGVVAVPVVSVIIVILVLALWAIVNLHGG
jgi:hypothetical protein